jgi:putative hydrolase of the HAD superfamily
LAQIRAIFWDLGGVLLTNAWDRAQRERAFSQFQLDPVEFGDRHEMVVSSFERGKLSLDEYLDRTVFYRSRPFSRDNFKEFMFSLSQPDTATLELARGLARSAKYFMSTINNESMELNLYRIEKFALKEIFSLFVSSCFVGLRKPEAGIYKLALEITQRAPENCCFIDDRPLNLEAAKRLGMNTIEMDSTEQLRQALKELGVEA